MNIPSLQTGAIALSGGLMLPVPFTGEDEAPVTAHTYTEAGDVGMVFSSGVSSYVFNDVVQHIEVGSVGLTVGAAGLLTEPQIYTEVGDVGVRLDGSARFGIERVRVWLIAEHRMPVRVTFISPYFNARRVAHAAPYGIAQRRALAHAAPYGLTSQGRHAHIAPYELGINTKGRRAFHARYALNVNTVQVITEGPYITALNRRMEVAEASVSTEADNAFWTARVRLTTAADYYALKRSDEIVLHIEGDDWALVVDSLSKNRSSRVDASFDVTALSPASLLMDESITKTWPATSAHAIVEELLGAVDWQIIDWIVPAERLAAVNVARSDVVRQVMEAAGAVLESMPDGTLRARYLYPVSIPNVSAAAIDHDLEEGPDIVTLRDSFVRKPVCNSITLSDEAADFGYLQAERDPSQQNDILAGEQQRYVVWLDSRTQIVETLLSDGTLIDLGTRLDEFEEVLQFDGTDRAGLQRPVHSNLTWVWYGAGLGDLRVGPDERSVIAEQSGVAMARVNYTAQARVFAVQSPAASGGSNVQFPILVHVIGAIDEGATVNGMKRITVMRGDGDAEAEDAVVPLASSEAVLLQHGRNFIDEQAQKRDVSMDVRYRGAFMKGQLCQVADSMDGTTWRGQVRSVEHRCARAQVLTALGVERFL